MQVDVGENRTHEKRKTPSCKPWKSLGPKMGRSRQFSCLPSLLASCDWVTAGEAAVDGGEPGWSPVSASSLGRECRWLADLAAKEQITKGGEGGGAWNSPKGICMSN